MEFLVFQAFKETIKGFGKNHAKTYCFILNNPNSSVLEISRNTGIPRESCYKIVAELEEAGLVKSIPVKPVAYAPKNPKKAIKKIFNKTIKKLETNKTKILKSIKETKKQKALNIVFYNESKADILKKGMPVRDKTEILKIKKVVDSIYAKTFTEKIKNKPLY